jgi:hypothetical protein
MMASSAPPSLPPCGLTQEKVLSLASLGIPLVGAKCQNLYEDANGNECVCGKAVGRHPSELTGE